jgi:hypothetical protein
MPTLARDPFHRPGWVYEEKYDGWRMLAFKDGDRVRLVSRNGVDHTERFHNIAAAVSRLPGERLIVDGEVCVFDQDLVSHSSTSPCHHPRSTRRHRSSWCSTASMMAATSEASRSRTDVMPWSAPSTAGSSCSLPGAFHPKDSAHGRW